MNNNFSALLIAVMISITSTSVIAEVAYNDVLTGPEAPGGGRGYNNQYGLDGVENIRLSDGSVNYLHKDIVVPVSKDLNIEIYRYYGSPQKVPHSLHYYGGKSVLGIGWDLHMEGLNGHPSLEKLKTTPVTTFSHIDSSINFKSYGFDWIRRYIYGKSSSFS